MKQIEEARKKERVTELYYMSTSSSSTSSIAKVSQKAKEYALFCVLLRVSHLLQRDIDK